MTEQREELEQDRVEEEQPEREKPVPDPLEGCRAPFVVDRDLGDENDV